jgi:NIPSNAP
MYDRRMTSCCPVVELRQYTLHPGRRDVLIELFEREFIESQELVGMRIVGQFRDLDNPDRFVWIRAFSDMVSRAEGLAAFYGGPTWKAHRSAANATMVDSSNVLLLRPSRASSGFSPPKSARPAARAGDAGSSLVVATIFHRDAPVDEAFRSFFERGLIPLMNETLAPTFAYFETEPAENTFPALPVRSGEHVFVAFASFQSIEHYGFHRRRLAESAAWNEFVLPALSGHVKGHIEHLRLQPTSRSLLG